VRLLCADLHPDHDSVCTFRRANGALLKSSFEQVLAMAAQMRVLKVGQVTLAVDGTKILANASKHSAVSHGRALAQIELLEKHVTEFLSKADGRSSRSLKPRNKNASSEPRRQVKSLEDVPRNRLGKALGTRTNLTSPTRRAGS
jgi:hypothetical protein